MSEIDIILSKIKPEIVHSIVKNNLNDFEFFYLNYFKSCKNVVTRFSLLPR